MPTLRTWTALLTLALLGSPTGAQTPVPALPALTLDSYPSPMREAVARAYREANARPADAEAAGSLARLLHSWEQWEAAHQAYARAAALAPRALDWTYLDGCVLQRLARHEEAVARLRDALAISAGYLPARLKLAEALIDAGKLDESGRLFEALVEIPATQPQALFGLGRIAAARGRHEDAVSRLTRAVALFPEWGAAHYALALSLRTVGRRDEAQRAIERHAQFGARWPGLEDPLLAGVSALRDDARARLRRGLRLADDGDTAGAVAELEAALELDPSMAVAHEGLIKLYGRSQDWAKAEAHYRSAVAIGFNLADLHYDYGVLLGLQGKWEDAAEAYRRAVVVNPQHALAHNNLGQLFERERRFEAALEAYRRAVASQPTFRLARFNAGRALLALGRPREAIVELDALQQPRDAESPRYLFAMAVAHLRAGDKDEGVRWATEARQLAAVYGQHDLAAAIDQQLGSIR
jgi:tetratricopeptide (TPR) repeat protein